MITASMICRVDMHLNRISRTLGAAVLKSLGGFSR